MIRRFIAFYKPHRKLFFQDMLCAFLVAVADLFYPMITRNIINDYVPDQNLRLFLFWACMLLFIYVAKAGLNYFIQYQGHVMGVRMQGDMRQKVFRRLQRLPFSYFDEHRTGAIMSRIINDLQDISELAHHGPEDLFLSLVLLVSTFIILCTINVPLTLIVFATLPLVIFFAVKLRVRMNATSLATRVEIAEVNSTLENSIAGVRVTKSYTCDEHEAAKFDRSNERYKKAQAKRYKVLGEFNSGMTLFTDLIYLVVLVAGGWFYFDSAIDVGEFTMYLLYINTFLNPIRKLISFFEQYQNGMTGFQRYEEIMAEHEEPEDENALEMDRMEGVIDFEHVTFGYETEKDGGARNVIDDLSLHIDKGRTVALVGPSGGGKTTLCHLIPRFYEVSSGRILIDGHDITTLSRMSLRKNIGLVQQDVFLFTGTIRENIAYGDLDASEEEIEEAARKANIHEYILSLPDGYDTYIGERGVKLSGGQKQRISIARIFLKDPAILILDEATSALDNATEMLIQESLEKLSKGRTCLVVAHRLSTIKHADEIIVLSDEGILERGTHEELLAKGGEYAKLYQYQFRE